MACSLDSEHVFQVSSKYFLKQQMYYKMSKVLHDADDDDAKAVAIPQISSKNS